MLFNKNRFLTVVACAGMLMASTSSSSFSPFNPDAYSINAANIAFNTVGVLGLAYSIFFALEIFFGTVELEGVRVKKRNLYLETSVVPLDVSLLSLTLAEHLGKTACAAFVAGVLVECIGVFAAARR